MQDGEGRAVLKASLEYYDTVKIRLEMVTWIYQRCHAVIGAYTYVAMFESVGRCFLILYGRCSPLNSAYKSNWEKFSVWRGKGRGR